MEQMVETFGFIFQGWCNSSYACERSESSYFNYLQFVCKHTTMKDCASNNIYQKDIFLPLGGIKKKPTTMKDEECEAFDKRH